MSIVHEGGRIYDTLTGERVEIGDRIVDTGILAASVSIPTNQRNLYLKEATLVRLVEAAGLSLCGEGCASKRNVGVSDNAQGVVAEDVRVGDGEDSVGTAEVRGSSTSKRRSAGKTKS